MAAVTQPSRPRGPTAAWPRTAPVSLGLLTAGLLLLSGTLSPALAQAAYRRLDVCNQGNVTIHVARVWDDNGGWGPGWTTYVGEGWWSIEPGDCERVLLARAGTFHRAWLSFVYKDNAGNVGVSRVVSNEGPFEPSSASFCLMTGPFTYTMRHANALALAQDCPEIASLREPPARDRLVRAPFTLEWRPRRGILDPGDVSSHIFNVRPDARVPITFPFPGAVRAPAAATESAFPSPVIVPPRPAPKPFQADTATATFLEKSIARWKEGDGQWFYDNGSAVQRIKDGPQHNLGLFDWPRVYTTLPENIGVLLQSIESPEARRLGIKENIRLGEDGRLHISSGDGTAWRTTSLQSLDTEGATYSSGFVRIPCRTGYEHCIYDNFSGLEDTLRHNVGVDPDGARAVIAGFRALKVLFGSPTREVLEDGRCSCLRYDVGVAVAQSGVTSSPRASDASARPGLEVAAAGNLAAARAQDPAADAARNTSEAGWYTTLIILACGVVWTVWSLVKSAKNGTREGTP